MIPCSDTVRVLERDLDVDIPLVDGLIGDLDVHTPIFSLQETRTFRVTQSNLDCFRGSIEILRVVLISKLHW